MLHREQPSSSYAENGCPKYRKVLIFAAQGFGDALETTPLIASLRKQLGSDAMIDVVVTQKEALRLFSSLPHLVNNVVYLRLWERGKTGFVLDLLRFLRRKRYDCSFLAYPHARWEYHILSKCFRVRERFAHRYPGALMQRILRRNDALVPIHGKHNVERNMDLLAAAGLGESSPRKYIVPHGWLSTRGRLPFTVGIHIGSTDLAGRSMRRWPPALFRALAILLREEGYKVTLISGPHEREATDIIAREAGTLEVWTTDLPELGQHLSELSCVVANDSGIAHFAAGVGTPVIALFGPTPIEHAPYASNAVPIRLTECPPCFDIRTGLTGCPMKIDFACIRKDIPVEYVLNAVKKIVEAPILDELHGDPAVLE